MTRTHRGARRIEHRQVDARRPHLRPRRPAGQPAAGPGELRVADFTHLGDRWQAIDAPGSIEFLHVATDALLAADVAVICVAPDPDAAPLAAPYLRAVEAAGTPGAAVRQPRRRGHGADPRPRRRPAGLRQPPDPAAPDPDPRRRQDHRRRRPRLGARLGLPGGRAVADDRAARRHGRPRARGARRRCSKHLSELDDHLLEELIEDREPPSAEIYALCARALAENQVLEALIGSGLHGNGVVRLLKALRHEAPGPEALRARLQAQAGLDEPPAAVVFAGAYRKHIGTTAAAARVRDPARRPPASAAARRASSPRPTRARRGTSTRSRPGEIVSRGQGRPPRPPASSRRRARCTPRRTGPPRRRRCSTG